MVLSDYEKDQLKKMIEANDTKDMTNKIRENKHSIKLKEGIESIIKLRNENMEMYINDKNEFEKLVLNTNSFLFNNYTDIYNKIMKNEVDIKILNKFLDLLKQIEDGRLDQHEASFMVGSILKEMYVDSAIKRAEKLDEESEKLTVKPLPNKEISWKQYKALNNC
tara:strand:- start:8553 stop:9047 length:495 start_codon:yes stop_codon:yes gene_type:complete